MNLLDLVNRNTHLLSRKGVNTATIAAAMSMRNHKFAFSTKMKHTSTKLHRLSSNLVASKIDGRLSWDVHQVKEGANIEGWQVEEVSPVKDFHLIALRLKHPQTGARFLHLSRPDKNQAFSVGFRTPPPDSSGLPHILEHTVLCGSQLFPVRDPFFKMLGGRTLATFMNAMTGPDYTMYPFATRDPADFSNLMSIYLDAVFRPRLRETDFRQEGWRLEHSDPFDSSSPIVFKGVVFNEMKGAFSDPQSIFGQRLLCSLLPKGAYGKVSGGEPLEIPSLSWEDLRSFHAHYYHPGNARFFSYGELNLPKVLEYVTENYVEASQKELPAVTEIHREPRWTKPRQEHVDCGRDAMAPNPENQTTVAVATACCDIHDLDETFLLDILSDLLIRGPEAPFYSRLIEPGLGSGYASSTGYDSSTRDTIFAVGLQGLKNSDVEKALQSIKDAVNAAVTKGEGLESERIEAVLHRVELAARDESHCMGSSLGLSLLSEITPLWNHDGDVVSFLRVGDRVESLKKRLRDDPDLLKKVTEKYLGEGNPHQLVLTMSPKEGFEESQLKEEEKLLNSKVSKLSSDDKEHIYQFGMKLAKEQKADEDLSCLPRLCASDLSPLPEPDGAVLLKDSAVPIQVSAQPTNGVAYIRSAVDVAGLPEDLQPYLPLFCLVASKMGTSERDARDFDRAVSLATGGISFGVNVVGAPAPACSPASLRSSLLMSTMCLERNAPKALKLCSELWQAGAGGSWMDSNRLAVLLRETAAALANGVPYSGHAYAMSAASSRVSPAARKRENLVLGTKYLETVRKAALQASQSESGSAEILGKLKQVGNYLMGSNCGSRLRFSINSSPESEPNILSEVSSFLKNISVGPSATRVNSLENELCPDLGVSPNTHYVLPLPVNFAAKAIATGVAYTHPDHAPLKVLAKLLSARYLHPHIREEGGAYGSGADVSADGVFIFFSYRDPHSVKTLDVFHDSEKWAVKSSPKSITETYLEEAKIGIFQRVDAPVPPGSRGLDRFLRGVDDNLLKWHREALMAVTCDDLVRVAGTYLSLDSKLPVSCSLLGPQNEVLEKDSKWKVVMPED
ncbi:presequence protease, mitochondrial [Ischnura elegans]|uniref:presequence protease, mitochondrial n=1 Tax=Ischnura elegans TaxID=197161 RepID=UPI001ED8689E|nr:presequence protease, mitochondrial [Ischnura elegans]